MRHVFATMGTVASVLADHAPEAGALAEVERIFDAYDRDFSLFRDDSPLTRIARGEMHLLDGSDLIRDEYARALSWRDRTDGWFTPNRPDGVIDLSGTIKAVAMEAASRVLESAGVHGVLGVGGDLLLLGDEPRAVGVVAPDDRKRLIAEVPLGSRRALATSGSAERGDHIWSQWGSTDIIQASVLSSDIVTSDVLATSIVAAGTAAMASLLETNDVDALVVTADGMLATPGWPRVPN